MNRFILIIGLALLSLSLIMACGKQEEPAKVQKPAAKQQPAAEKKPVAQPQSAAEQRATPAHKETEHKEPYAKHEQEKKKPVKAEAAHQETTKHEHQKPESTKSQAKQGQKSDLNQALLTYLAKTGTDPKYADPHQTTQIDLNGDGHQDALVLLQNPMYFCGSGGCTMLVFKGTTSGFEFVSRSSLIRGPLLVSESKTHGWRDLIVEVSGGGAAPKKVALKYTGSKYPLNPSTLPALPKNQQVKGTKVF